MDSVRLYKFTLDAPVTAAALSTLMTVSYNGTRIRTSLFRALEVDDADTIFAQLNVQTTPGKVGKCLRNSGYGATNIARFEPSERPTQPKMTRGVWANGGRTPRADAALPEDPSKWTKAQLVEYVNTRKQEDAARAVQEEEWRIQDQQLAAYRATMFECPHNAHEAWNARLYEEICDMFEMSLPNEYEKVYNRAFERIRIQKGERPDDI